MIPRIPPLEIDDPEELHDCTERGDHFLIRVDSPANAVDWEIPGSRQSYQIFKCSECGDVWGVRFQWDAGTGNDDHYFRFGQVDPSTVKRHY